MAIPQHVIEYNGSTPAGELAVPWPATEPDDFDTEYQAAQEMLAIHACGNLYPMNGRGSGPNV